MLGAFSSLNEPAKIGFIEPLRNKEIRDDAGELIAPAYDLMEGVAGQNGSYRKQIEKYILKDGRHTSLSKLRGWTAKNR